MKYLKYFENIENTTLNEVITNILSGDKKPDDILLYLDIQEKHKILETSKDELIFNIKIKDFEDLLEIKNGVLGFLENVKSHEYEYYVDESESDYIHYCMRPEEIEKLLNFAKFLNFKIDASPKVEGQFTEFFEEFNLKDITDSYITSLSMIKGKAVSKLIKKEIEDRQPFHYMFLYDNEYDLEVTLQYEDVLEFLDRKEVDSISELLEMVGNTLPYNYEIEYNCSEYEDDKDYEQLKNDIKFEISLYWDDVLNIPEDKFWIKNIKYDNIDLIKDHFDDIDWYFKIRYYQENKYAFEYAQPKSNCYKWFVSNDFSNRLDKGINTDFDDKLQDLKIKFNATKLGLF